MSSAHPIDIVLVLAFFLVCLLFGIGLARRQTKFDTYILGGRDLGLLHLVGTVVSTIAGFSIVFAHAIYGYTYGISVMWTPPAVLIAFLIFALFVPKLKSIADARRYSTYADMLLDRYDRKTQILGSLLTLVNFLALIAIEVFGIGLILSASIGWSFTFSVIFGAGIVVLYTLLGGFMAVVWTDLLQMFATGIGLLVLLPFAYIAVSNAGGLTSTLPPEAFGLWTWGIDKIIGTNIVVVPVFFSSQDLWQRVFASKDTRTAQLGVVISGVIVFLGAVSAVYLGMVARALMPAIDPQYALPRLIMQILAPGFVGIVMVGYLAAFTSSADSFLLVVSSAVAQDFYRSRLRHHVDESRLVAITRYVTAIFGILSIVIIVIFPDVVKILFTVLTWLMILVPATLAGFFWRKATANGAFWSILTGWLVAIIYTIVTGDAEAAGIVAVVPTVGVLVLVSLLSSRR